MKIFCINSIKGGSGKTTVSLAILYNRARAYMTYLEAEERKAKERGTEKTKEKQFRFAYIDLDLLGTGVSRLIYSEEDRKNVRFYNDLENDQQDYFDCCNRIPAAEEAKIGIDVYLLNDSDDCKGIYGSNNREIFETRNISRFKTRAQSLIKKVLDSGRYDTVVLDNSPSYDYVAADMYEFICKNYNTEENQIVNAFVTTLEKTHVYTTVSKVSNILRLNEYNIGVYIICNDMNDYIKDNKEKDYSDYGQELYDLLLNWNKNPRKSTSPLFLPGVSDQNEGFTKKHIVFVERLEINKEFLFTEKNVLNQKGILEKYSSSRLSDGFALSEF